MTDKGRGVTIDWLSSMTDKDFVELMYEVIQKRSWTSDTEEEQGHFILGNATLDLDDGTWGVDVVGLHDPIRYSNGFEKNVPLCQFGDCPNCGSATVSWAKYAKCSVCGDEVNCT